MPFYVHMSRTFADGVRRILTVSTALFVLACCTGSPASASPRDGFDAWIRAEMIRAGIPGASVAVVRDHSIGWASGFGVADKSTGRLVTVATAFQAASVSKPISAIAMIQSFAEHGLPLDAPAPPISFPGGGIWTLPNPFPQAVTPRRLLSHTGGLGSFHYRGFEPGQPLPTIDQELNGLPPATTPAVTVVTEPGTTWSYAPGGYTLLQALTQQQNGWQPFDVIVDRYLLDRVSGVSDSSFAAPPHAGVAAAMAVPYQTDGSPLPGGPRVFNTEASGSMVGTPTDLARIMIAFQDAVAGRPSSIPAWVAQEMLVRQPGVIPQGKCFGTGQPDVSACRSAWGLGFDVNLDSRMNHLADGQPTGNWFGHTGFNSGYLTFFLGSKTGGDGVVLMINSAPTDMGTSDIPQADFMRAVVQRVADDERWQD